MNNNNNKKREKKKKTLCVHCTHGIINAISSRSPYFSTNLFTSQFHLVHWRAYTNTQTYVANTVQNLNIDIAQVSTECACDISLQSINDIHVTFRPHFTVQAQLFDNVTFSNQSRVTVIKWCNQSINAEHTTKGIQFRSLTLRLTVSLCTQTIELSQSFHVAQYKVYVFLCMPRILIRIHTTAINKWKLCTNKNFRSVSNSFGLERIREEEVKKKNETGNSDLRQFNVYYNIK